MLPLLLGCRGYFDSVPPEVILDRIVDRWWYLTEYADFNNVDNFYLEYIDGDAGDVWLDFQYGPRQPIDVNDLGGTWAIMADGRIRVTDQWFHPDSEYYITVREAVDHGCFDVAVDMTARISDTICPYDGPILW